MPIEFSDDVDPSNREEVPDVAAQRVEAEHVRFKEPCIRIWLTPDEFGTAKQDDDLYYTLSNGNIGVWLKVSAIEDLKKNGEMSLYYFLMERKIDDHVV